MSFRYSARWPNEWQSLVDGSLVLGVSSDVVRAHHLHVAAVVTS